MKKQSKSGQDNRGVVLSLTAPKAEAVYLEGDFSQWQRDKHPMEMTRDGRWTKAICFTPGTYEYKCWADGS
jgi:1,4-alpha-glucan branching enzyme